MPPHQRLRAPVQPDGLATEVVPGRAWPFLLVPGILLVAAGAVMAAVYSVAFIRRGETVGGLELPFVDAYPSVVDIVMPAFAAFLVGGCLAFVGELLRRGVIVRGYGNNVAIFRPLGALVHAAWVLVPLAAWVVAVPYVLSHGSTGQAQTPGMSFLEADSDAIFLSGVYGGLAAALVGALVGSLVKKLWFVRAERRHGPLPAEQRSRGWWMFSYYWRCDVWLVSLGFLLLGLAPLPAFLGSAAGIVVTVGGGAVLAAAGLVTCTMYRRAGMPLGTGSSVSGGAQAEA